MPTEARLGALTLGAYETPFGDLAVVTSPDGAVRFATFRGPRAALADLPRHVRGGAGEVVEGEQPAVARAIDAWLDGDGSLLTEVPVAQEGSPYFAQVWEAVRTIPTGETASYVEVAQMTGRPRAMRAVGTACARNLTTPFTPCHRVIRSGGIVGTFGPGPDIKGAMLALEARR